MYERVIITAQKETLIFKRNSSSYSGGISGRVTLDEFNSIISYSLKNANHEKDQRVSPCGCYSTSSYSNCFLPDTVHLNMGRSLQILTNSSSRGYRLYLLRMGHQSQSVTESQKVTYNLKTLIMKNKTNFRRTLVTLLIIFFVTVYLIAFAVTTPLPS